MISRSWKKFLSSREGVAVLGTLANTYTALCTRTGARHVPVPAAFPRGTQLGEVGALWPRVLREGSGAGEWSKGPHVRRRSRSVQPLAPLCPSTAPTITGLSLGCRSQTCALRPQLSKHSRDGAVAGGWSRPVQGHGCGNPGWGREFVFLVPAEFASQVRW